MEEQEEKKEYKVTAVTTRNDIVEIMVQECDHCKELIPKVDDCPQCGTPYNHLNTVENMQTGYLHYVYECSGCPEEERKAQKVLKLSEIVDDTRLNMRKNLADDFLKSGGY